MVNEYFFRCQYLLDESDKLFSKGIISVASTRYVKKIGNHVSEENILDFPNSELKDEILNKIQKSSK